MGGAGRRLIRILQFAHAGEDGAARAYLGHALSLRDPAERADILRIREEELDHRGRVAAILRALGARPDPVLEVLLSTIGRFVSAFCRLGGWFLPMYGAGLVERRNVDEYLAAAAAAREAGRDEFLDELLDMAAVEREHEAYLRSKAASHPAWRLLPGWEPPAIQGNLGPGPASNGHENDKPAGVAAAVASGRLRTG